MREIFEEMHVERIAIISHAVMLFAALEAAGSWWDLWQQRVTITPLEEALQLQPLRKKATMN